MWIMGRRIVLAFTMALTLCSAEFTFPTDADVIRPFTLEESRYMIDKVNAYRSNVSRIPGDLCHMVSAYSFKTFFLFKKLIRRGQRLHCNVLFFENLFWCHGAANSL